MTLEQHVLTGEGRTTEGSPPWARDIAPRPCIRSDPLGIRTMKQPCASAARLRGGGPILISAWKPCRYSGHRHLGPLSTPYRRSAAGRRIRMCLLRLRRSGRWPQHDAVRTLTGGDHAPQGDEQLSGEGDDHGGLARALGAAGPRPIPLRERALLLEPEEAPGELDQGICQEFCVGPR